MFGTGNWRTYLILVVGAEEETNLSETFARGQCGGRRVSTRMGCDVSTTGGQQGIKKYQYTSISYFNMFLTA
jgi:hypothetical protein